MEYVTGMVSIFTLLNHNLQKVCFVFRCWCLFLVFWWNRFLPKLQPNIELFPDTCCGKLDFYSFNVFANFFLMNLLKLCVKEDLTSFFNLVNAMGHHIRFKVKNSIIASYVK